MPEMIKGEVDETLAHNFERKVIEKYGYKKSSMKKAID